MLPRVGTRLLKFLEEKSSFSWFPLNLSKNRGGVSKSGFALFLPIPPCVLNLFPKASSLPSVLLSPGPLSAALHEAGGPPGRWWASCHLPSEG